MNLIYLQVKESYQSLREHEESKSKNYPTAAGHVMVTSDGGECVIRSYDHTSLDRKGKVNELKEKFELKEKNNCIREKLSGTKEKSNISKEKSNDTKEKSNENREKHENKEKHENRDKCYENKEKHMENKDKLKEKEKHRDLIVSKSKQENFCSSGEIKYSSANDSSKSDVASTDKVKAIIERSEKKVSNSSKNDSEKINIALKTSKTSKDEKDKCDGVHPVPSAFESNLMQIYSSVRALKEAGRPISNLVNGSREEKDVKPSSESVHSRSSSQQQRGETSSRSEKHHKSSSHNKTESSHRSKHHDKDRRHDKDHDIKSRSHKYSCSRCYKRSKIKKASIGVQCRRDKTFEKLVYKGFKPEGTSAMPRPVPLLQNRGETLKYGHLIRVETYPNGGASVVHLYQDEIHNLSQTEMDELVDEYFKVSY